MKKISLRFIIFSLLIAGLVSFAKAQSSGLTSPSSGLTPPYIDGETLTYEATFNKLILRGANLAELTFTTSKTSDGKNFLVNGEAHSKGTLAKIFKFSFLQRLESTIDGEKFNVLKYTRYDQQKERIRTSEAIFDYADKKVTYVEIDPKDPTRPPRRIASDIEDVTYDISSGIYVLRHLPLAVGEHFTLNISEAGLIYKIPVRVAAQEMQNTILGKVQCFRLEPEVFGPGRMIENEGSLKIWITADDRRIPVLGEINTEIKNISFKISVKLTKLENKKET